MCDRGSRRTIIGRVLAAQHIDPIPLGKSPPIIPFPQFPDGVAGGPTTTVAGRLFSVSFSYFSELAAYGF